MVSVLPLVLSSFLYLPHLLQPQDHGLHTDPGPVSCWVSTMHNHNTTPFSLLREDYLNFLFNTKITGGDEVSPGQHTCSRTGQAKARAGAILN